MALSRGESFHSWGLEVRMAVIKVKFVSKCHKNCEESSLSAFIFMIRSKAMLSVNLRVV